MNNIADPNNQSQIPQQQPMPQGGAFVPPMPTPVVGRGRGRRMAEQVIFPKWLSKNALIAYFLALAVVTFMYSTYSLPWYYVLSGVIAVLVFFLYGSTAIKDTSLDKIRKESRFEKRIFLIAFVITLVLMVFGKMHHALSLSCHLVYGILFLQVLPNLYTHIHCNRICHHVFL